MRQEDYQALAIALPEDIVKAKWCGDFERATRLIDRSLADPRTPQCFKTRLRLEKEIIARLPLDYTYTLEQATELVRRDIPDFTQDELAQLMDEGAAEWIYIQGVPHLAARFYETLLKVNPNIARRAGQNGDFESSAENQMLMQTIRDMRRQGGVRRHIHIRASLRIKDEAFRPGQRVRVHMPIPAEAPNMRDIRILHVSEPGAQIGAPQSEQRTVYFEKVMQENEPFVVEYEYDCLALYHDLKEEEVQPGEPAGDLAQELPHILFTPTIRALASELAEGEQNPLRLARRFYDFCTTKVRYSFMREYFTITQIPEYAALNLRGDCGVQALLFITLCRSAGIAARWQSGLYVTPAEAGCHDWAMFYIEPYGWLYADPSFGGSAWRNGNQERWNHYFGNLDPYRMVANRRFQGAFVPDKQQLRLDPYDNQGGEVEYDDCGLKRSDLEYGWEIISHEEV